VCIHCYRMHSWRDSCQILTRQWVINEIDATYEPTTHWQQHTTLQHTTTPYAPSNEIQLTTQQRVLNNIMIHKNRTIQLLLYTGISRHHQQHYILSPSYEMQLMSQQCVVSAIDDSSMNQQIKRGNLGALMSCICTGLRTRGHQIYFMVKDFASSFL